MKKLIILGALAAFFLSSEVNAQSTTQVISVAGNSESLAVWDNLFDQVAEFSPVFAYDRPGLGKSSISEETTSLDVRVKELEALLNEMNIEGMVYVDPVMDTDNPYKLREILNSQNLDGQPLASEYLAFQRLSMSRRSPGTKPES